MPDVDALKLRLIAAIALAGVGPACGKDEAAADSGVSVDFAKIKGNPDKKREPEAGGSSSGGGEESTTGPTKPPVDPVEFCRTEAMTLTVDDARKQRRPGTGELHDCPVSINSASGWPMLTLRDNATQLLRDAGDEEHCCYEEEEPRVIKGRPFAVAEGTWLPSVWLGPMRGTPSAEEVEAGRAWLADARAEWASVPAFERAATELQRVGAPARLIAACRRAADDERRHTLACRTIAARLLSRQIRLEALPPARPRDLDLAALLRATFLEGALAETVAALVARRSAAAATDPEIAETLHTIADEETEHAALAWETIAWGLGRLSWSERTSFVAWARRRRPDPASLGPSSGPDLSRLGRLGDLAEARVCAQAWERCVLPALSRLGAQQPLSGAYGESQGPAQVRHATASRRLRQGQLPDVTMSPLTGTPSPATSANASGIDWQ